ncbi:EamA family transporter [Dyella monticola]|uniref:EamA family transporter n=1 Tax=Dyella monticola TaxID=1927958 RepID=A0A370WYT0_9GAMM|nr:EamA family transporter [Dyella monticola]RDS81157.1 EamA family transporter [Dyella monticola]
MKHRCYPAPHPQARATLARAPFADRVPAQAYFVASATFHYLGPACAALLFRLVDPLGVAWLRIATAAVVFACWRKPWRCLLSATATDRWVMAGLGVSLALMNVCFYLAIARLPLATVGAIEFLGPIALAAVGVRNRRNVIALILVVTGVYLLTEVRLSGEPLGYAFAFANGLLFVLYVMLGHRVASVAGGGIDRLAASMLMAFVTVMPLGLRDALPALHRPALLLAGIGVGICSSVIPYVTDQLAMARLPRASFALMLALLPATAAIIGFLVLRQIPKPIEVFAIALIVVAIAVHRPQRT